MQSEPARALDVLRSSIFINVIIFLIFGSLIAMLVSRNLSLPFQEIVTTLQGVKNGHFDKKVRVTTNDEIGYTGDVINEMTEGLIERERMQQSLNSEI
jgi:adenylate cyclase